MTDQELFDNVATHLLRQGKRALDAEGKCVYRSFDGLKCAAGCLIDDEHYSSGFENLGVTTRAKAEGFSEDLLDALNASGVSDEQFELVSELQVIHDAYEPRSWSRSLAQLAKDLNLTFHPELAEITDER